MNADIQQLTYDNKLSLLDKNQTNKSYDRSIQDIRFILTQVCNYKCYFCHSEGIKNQLLELLTPQDYGFITDCLSKKFNIDSVTLTGGEPLILKNIVDVTRNIKYQDVKTTLITNGILLPSKKEIGKYIDNLYVSIHSLDKEEYKKITGTNVDVDKIKNNLFDFKNNYPDVKIKFNVVLMDGINNSYDNVNSYIDFAKDLGASIKYMEIFPITSERHMNIDDFRNDLLKNGFKFAGRCGKHKQYQKDGVNLSLMKLFCYQANKTKDPLYYCSKNSNVYVTSDGSLSLCRNNNKKTYIYDEVRNKDKIGFDNLMENAVELSSKKCYF